MNMKLRKYLFEFEDLTWFPDTIRESMTDYLRYLISALKFYGPVTVLIQETLTQTHSNQIIDLCSGGGGAIEQIYICLQKQSVNKIKIIITDKYPNKNAFELLAKKTKNNISFVAGSIDAANVPAALKGIRTLFSSFHHFNKPFAKSVIKNAVESREGICIFDSGNKNIWMALGAIFIHPIVFLFCTPFFKPFRLSRLIFTYLIPIIPFCTIWDGVVSIIRLYTPKEMLELAKEVESENYYWKAGKTKSSFGMQIAWLMGYPKP